MSQLDPAKVVDIIGWHHSLDALEWAKQNCPSYITNTGVIKNGEPTQTFFFGNETEATIFRLKWT